MAGGARLPGLLAPQTGKHRADVVGPRILGYIGLPRRGPRTVNQPIEIRSLTAPAKRVRSFFDDWYNRIHASPRLIDFGFVASDVQQRVSVWNAYLTPSTLDTITLLDNSQITIAGPTLPKTLGRLQSVHYEVQAAGSGNPFIDATVLFGFFDRPDMPRVPVLGMRGRMFDFRPNWAQPVQVNLEYRSDIFTSRSGKEQRVALRQAPRKKFEFTIAVHRSKLRAFEQLMARWQTKPVAAGDPTRHVPLIAPLALGDTVQLSEIPQWLAVGQMAMLEVGEQRQILMVDAFDMTANTVTFSSISGFVWPTGTTLRPTISGLLETSISQSHLTDELAEVGITLSVEPGSEIVPATAPGMLQHNGREVFPFAENWSESVESQFLWDREMVDFGYGRQVAFTPTQFGRKVRRASFLNVSTEQAAEMSDFFNRMKGQQGEFYWPTNTNDLLVAEPLIIGNDTIRVPGRETFDNFAGDTVYRAVAIRLRDDRRIYRSIQDIFIAEDDTFIQLTEPWMFTIPLEEIVSVSWMTVARFASDQFTAEWTTSEVVQTQLAVQTLEDRPVETPVPAYDGAAQWALESWGLPGVDVLDRIDALVNST